jgi:hypothetical protein
VVSTYTRKWSLKETNLVIKCDEEKAIDAAIGAVVQARTEIERLILKHPDFRWSLEPVKLEGKHPRVIELMLRAGEIADVGPFAAVAGAISQVAAEATLEAGAKNVVIENGGDIAIFGNHEFRVGIFAGDSKGSGKLGFLVRAEELPVGICTSSGTVGHSISFGEADAAVAVASDAAVADAAATSIGNAVTGEDVKISIKKGLERAKEIPEIHGCLIVRKGHFGTWGKIPQLIGLLPASREVSDTSARYRDYGWELNPVL